MIFTESFSQKHQKDVYEQFILEDLSLSEIAEGAGISRQGVHDRSAGARRRWRDTKKSFHLVERFFSVRRRWRDRGSAG